MEINQAIYNKHSSFIEVNHSLVLQHHLKFLTLPIHELELLALEMLQINPAIESFEPLTPNQSGCLSFTSLEKIPQPYQEVIFEQIPTQLLSSSYKILAEEIFSSLDKEGFLQQEEKEYLMTKFGIETEKVLYIMQQYSDLGFENRLFYWRHLLVKKGSNYDCVQLITNYTQELLEGDFKVLIKKTNLSFLAFKKKYLDVFKTLPLSPLKPGLNRAAETYIDIEITAADSVIDIAVQDPIPAYTVTKLIDGQNQEVKEFYKPHIQEINNFCLAVKKRKVTLEKIMQKIILIQKDYLLGESATPKSINPRDLSFELAIHPSTLARAIQNKTVLCMHGVIALKSLVTPPFIEEDKNCLLLQLKQLISKEDKEAPLSDEKLLSLLQAKGSKISRRTLTKYRNKLKIPDARRRFFS